MNKRLRGRLAVVAALLAALTPTPCVWAEESASEPTTSVTVLQENEVPLSDGDLDEGAQEPNQSVDEESAPSELRALPQTRVSAHQGFVIATVGGLALLVFCFSGTPHHH